MLRMGNNRQLRKRDCGGAQSSSGNFGTVLADLTPNTTYHFRAKAVGNGTNYGVDMTFTTPP